MNSMKVLQPLPMVIKVPCWSVSMVTEDDAAKAALGHLLAWGHSPNQYRSVADPYSCTLPGVSATGVRPQKLPPEGWVLSACRVAAATIACLLWTRD